MAAAASQDAYCTLLVNDGYLPGAMVLAHSLRDAGTKKLLVALVTLDTVSAVTIDQLTTVYDQILPVERIATSSPANLFLMDRPDLHSVFTKIALWRQTQFRRIVYVDADVVALRAPDELFARESAFSAAPDVGWPDCFNSGVMALTPNMGDYYALLALAQRNISFDGADQGLLNMHFTNWDRFSFAYNCTPSGHYQYVPAYKHFQSSISLIHFIGKDKPWLIGRETKRSNGVYDELLGRWWAVYDRHFRIMETAAQRPVTQWNSTVQQHVTGDYQQFPMTSQGHSASSNQPTTAGHFDQPPQPRASWESPSSHVEANGGSAPLDAPITDQPTFGEAVETGHYTAPPQPKFEPPQAEWDPIRQPPPAESRPEASNFPVQTYTMSDDRELFRPPRSYPEPPKDMWYEVPPKSPVPEKPKTIFPWEVNQAKATRVFPDETPSPPVQPPPQPQASAGGPAPLTVDTQKSESTSQQDQPTTPTIRVTPTETFVPFSEYTRSNAWDDLPEIERYVSRFRTGRRAKVQVVHSSETSAPADGVVSPLAQPPAVNNSASERRPSMLLTDFPTEVERPSLPVTPAPVRKYNFWGADEREAELPPAAGVPKPEDWDPLKKLEELQRMQVEVLAKGAAIGGDETGTLKELPLRAVPESSGQLLPTSEETEVPQTSVSAVSSSFNESAPAVLARESFEDGPDDADDGVFGL